MEQRRGRQILPLQRRPITLGEILLREEMREQMRQPAPRLMGRIMSPTRRLGPLANGRPRRPRGRTLSRSTSATSYSTSAVPSTSTGTSTSADSSTSAGPSTSASRSTSAGPSTLGAATSTGPSTSAVLSDDQSGTVRRRRRAPSAPMIMPRLTRWRTSTAESRMQNIYGRANGPRTVRRRGNSRATRPTNHNVVTRSESPDLFYNAFGWHRNAASGRHARQGPRSGPFWGGRPQLMQRHSRMMDVFDAHVIHRVTPYRSVFPSSANAPASTLYLRSTSRPRSMLGGSHAQGTNRNPQTGTPGDRELTDGIPNGSTDAARNGTSGRASSSELSTPVRRFIEFAAEFIPVNPHPPDAEPPEWSLDVTPADFGPFAIGRSAISRARSLAMIAALAQVDDSEANNQTNFYEN